MTLPCRFEGADRYNIDDMTTADKLANQSTSKTPSKPSSKPRAIELFAGVGGFRLGIQDWWDVVWSNQWEPSTKTQHGSDCYVENFGSVGHVCESIEDVLQKVKDEEVQIPDHDLLVGGFPCQDYSVARTLNQASGISGKKGVLWWHIRDVLKIKRPRFILLENVDRLLKSPANQRGRDFAVMLCTLAQLGYRVEWRVINAADYGFPQRRRRVFIVGERTDSTSDDLTSRILSEGILARAFNAEPANTSSNLDVRWLKESELVVSDDFGVDDKKSWFQNAGVMQNFHVATMKVQPIYDGERSTLGDILQSPDSVDGSFFLNGSRDRWEYLKGAKSEPRKHRGTDSPYNYAEGAIAYPDPLDKPSRTVLTGEGGPSPSRFKHVVKVGEELRRLTPVELERLNGFPDDWTAGLSDNKRAFLMGNALVVGVVARIAEVLRAEITNEHD